MFRFAVEGGETLYEVSDVGECSVADAGEVVGGGLSRVTSVGGDSTNVRLWMGSGGAVSWTGVSCVPRSAVSVDGKGVPSDGASLELISIWASSERCRFFIVKVLSAGGRPLWE